MSAFQQTNYQEQQQESEQQQQQEPEQQPEQEQEQEPSQVEEILSTAEEGASTKKQGINWLVILAILIIAAGVYWYFFHNKGSSSVDGSDLPMSADAFDIPSGGVTE